jgi:hypothetical protein
VAARAAGRGADQLRGHRGRHHPGPGRGGGGGALARLRLRQPRRQRLPAARPVQERLPARQGAQGRLHAVPGVRPAAADRRRLRLGRAAAGRRRRHPQAGAGRGPGPGLGVLGRQEVAPARAVRPARGPAGSGRRGRVLRRVARHLAVGCGQLPPAARHGGARHQRREEALGPGPGREGRLRHAGGVLPRRRALDLQGRAAAAAAGAAQRDLPLSGGLPRRSPRAGLQRLPVRRRDRGRAHRVHAVPAVHPGQRRVAVDVPRLPDPSAQRSDRPVLRPRGGARARLVAG